jgi:hypothetical protein
MGELIQAALVALPGERMAAKQKSRTKALFMKSFPQW